MVISPAFFGGAQMSRVSDSLLLLFLYMFQEGYTTQLGLVPLRAFRRCSTFARMNH